MDAAGIKAYAGDRMERVFHLMEETLSSDISLLDRTNGSILDGGGKRIRPLLTLLAAGACGGVTEDTERLAAASELLHNATLLHDDVVDGASTRRGRPTVSALLNAPASVLIGDYWLSKAVGLVLDAKRETHRCVRIFAGTLKDLARGEMLQLEKTTSCDTSFEDYIEIVYCKTASLFEASARTGAISASAPAQWEEALSAYARALGIAFQIKDDILDYVGGDIGKPAGQDIAEQKVTMPLLAALETVSPARQQAVRQQLADGGAEAEILSFVREHGGVERAQTVLESYIAQAVEALAPLPEGTDKQCLADLARYSSIRKV